MNVRCARSRHSLLSDREFQIFEMLASGAKNAVIAGELFLSEKTVSTYKKRILNKLACKNEIELARYAIAECLLFDQVERPPLLIAPAPEQPLESKFSRPSGEQVTTAPVYVSRAAGWAQFRGRVVDSFAGEERPDG